MLTCLGGGMLLLAEKLLEPRGLDDENLHPLPDGGNSGTLVLGDVRGRAGVWWS